MTTQAFKATNGFDANGNVISNVGSPVAATDAATKGFASDATNLTAGLINAALIPTTAVVAGTYGGVGSIPTFTVDTTGRLTSAAVVAVSFDSSLITDATAAATPNVIVKRGASGEASFGDVVSVSSHTALGTVTAPTYSFVGDTDTGVFSPGANQLDIATGGVTAIAVSAGGDVTIRGDVVVNGGDITTTSTLANIVNATATTVNLGGAATTMTIGATTGITSIRNNLQIVGDAAFDGATTAFNSPTTTFATGVANLGGAIPPAAATTIDYGVAYRYNDGVAKRGFFGHSAATGKLTYIPNATLSSGNWIGSKGEVDMNVSWANLLSVPSPVVTVTLTGAVTGTTSATLTNLTSATLTLATTLSPTVIALGTDTSGVYAQSVSTSGNGITRINTGLESVDVTIVSDATDINTPSTAMWRNAAGRTALTTLALTNGTIASGTATTTTAVAETVDSFAAASFRSASYTFQVTSGVNYSVVTVQVVHNGATAFVGQNATNTGAATGVFTAVVSGANVEVRYAGAIGDIVKFVRTAVAV